MLLMITYRPTCHVEQSNIRVGVWLSNDGL